LIKTLFVIEVVTDILAMGFSFMALSFYFVLGNNTISIIVAGTTKAVWECLCQEYVSVPNEAGWGTIARHFTSSGTSKLVGSD
jgi:hypothetical protein